jgi:hypothetical protein
MQTFHVFENIEYLPMNSYHRCDRCTSNHSFTDSAKIIHSHMYFLCVWSKISVRLTNHRWDKKSPYREGIWTPEITIGTTSYRIHNPYKGSFCPTDEAFEFAWQHDCSMCLNYLLLLSSELSQRNSIMTVVYLVESEIIWLSELASITFNILAAFICSKVAASRHLYF